MPTEQETLDALVTRIAAKHMDRLAMPRGAVVLDENVSGWAEELQTRGFRVKRPPAGMSDDDIKKNWLGGQILITANSRDFILDATAFGYSVVAADKIEGLLPDQAAHLLSRAFVDHHLWSQRPSWVLVANTEGKHRFERLVD